MAHFPSIIPWINDMLDKDVDRDHFYTTFATIRFDVLVCLDTEPYEMLIGARGLNWACTLTISQNFEMQMDDYDFYSLDTFNKLGYKAKINTHTTSYIN